MYDTYAKVLRVFLSTLSLRRATFEYIQAGTGILFLSTLSLRRATVKLFRQNYECFISIHALLAESDREPTALRTPHHKFLSTLSLRRATNLTQGVFNLFTFLSTLSLRRATSHRLIRHRLMYRFLSTLSLRRATVHFDNYNLHCVISIHALLAESDFTCFGWLEVIDYFYPRSPCGERLVTDTPAFELLPISIHALLAESDRHKKIQNAGASLFLSTLSLRRATTSL